MILFSIGSVVVSTAKCLYLVLSVDLGVSIVSQVEPTSVFVSHPYHSTLDIKIILKTSALFCSIEIKL